MLRHPDDFGHRRHRQQKPAAALAAPFVDPVQQRMVAARELDSRYWARRWTALLRGDGRTVAEIAAADGRTEAEVFAAIDAVLRGEGVQGGLTELLARRYRTAPVLGRTGNREAGRSAGAATQLRLLQGGREP